MKNFIYILLLTLVTFLTTSCSKEPKLHKIKYDITFTQTPEYGYTNWLEIVATPSYQGDYNTSSRVPAINYEIAKSGHWDYEYLELKDGDKVSFSLWAAEGYYFEMRVYIDDTQVSYKKMYGEDVIEVSGWNTSTSNSYIQFTYNE